MKIVIDIPEETYEVVCRAGSGAPFVIVNAFRNATPLPKGHGKIVDIKPLMVGLYEGMGKETFTPIDVYKMLDECKAIIEADEEGSEEG